LGARGVDVELLLVLARSSSLDESAATATKQDCRAES
jgi:hypothetical protein